MTLDSMACLRNILGLSLRLSLRLRKRVIMHRLEAYAMLAVIIIIVVSSLYVPAFFILRKRGKGIVQQLGYVGLLCAAVLILFPTIAFAGITFRPEEYTLNLQPFLWLYEEDAARQFFVEVIPNIIMFIPLGFFLPAVFRGMRKFRRVAASIFLMSFCIEFFQYFIGRSSDIDDLITNLLGGLIGYEVFLAANHLFSGKAFWSRFIGEASASG